MGGANHHNDGGWHSGYGPIDPYAKQKSDQIVESRNIYKSSLPNEPPENVDLGASSVMPPALSHDPSTGHAQYQGLMTEVRAYDPSQAAQIAHSREILARTQQGAELFLNTLPGVALGLLEIWKARRS